MRLIDSINGNRSYPYSVETRSLVGQTGMSIHAAFELGELMSMLEGLAYDSLPVAYRELFSSFTFNALYGDKLYLQSPVLDALVGGEELAGAWYALSDVDYSAFYRSLYSGEGCTIGALCYAMMEQGDANHFFDSWNGGTAIASTLVELMGDATFTKSGSSDKWHFGIEELAAFVNSAVGEESCTASDLREAGVDALSIDMTLRADGSVDLKLALELSQEQQTMLRADCTVKGTESGSTVKGSVQVRNVCDVTFNGAMAVRTTDEEIAAVPPAGAVVIDLGPMADLQTAV